MQNVQIINDAELETVDGSGWKAQVAIGIGFAICPILGLGMAVGYYINS